GGGGGWGVRQKWGETLGPGGWGSPRPGPPGGKGWGGAGGPGLEGGKGSRRSRPRQHDLGAQPADRRGAERQPAAVEAGELHHDRETETRARLGLVEAAAAAGGPLAPLRGPSPPRGRGPEAHGAAGRRPAGGAPATPAR